MEPDTNVSSNEKGGIPNVHGTPEHRENVEEKEVHSVTPNSSDLESSGAVKGDDSDGRVVWTFTSIVATVSLSGLYVGML
jgi:hypothetical protein